MLTTPAKGASCPRSNHVTARATTKHFGLAEGFARHRTSPPTKPEPKSEIILYQTEDNRTRIEVRLDNETVWLTQNQMAELFQTSIPNVSMHIRNIFKDSELQPDSVVKELLTTAADGKKYLTRFYNLDVIINELDDVILTYDLPKHGLSAGGIGTARSGL